MRGAVRHKWLLWLPPLHGAWVLRVFGFGVGVVDHRRRRPLFSERYSGQYGIPRRRFIHVGPWCIRFFRGNDG